MALKYEEAAALDCSVQLKYINGTPPQNITTPTTGPLQQRTSTNNTNDHYIKLSLHPGPCIARYEAYDTAPILHTAAKAK